MSRFKIFTEYKKTLRSGSWLKNMEIKVNDGYLEEKNGENGSKINGHQRK